MSRRDKDVGQRAPIRGSATPLQRDHVEPPSGSSDTCCALDQIGATKCGLGRFQTGLVFWALGSIRYEVRPVASTYRLQSDQQKNLVHLFPSIHFDIKERLRKHPSGTSRRLRWARRSAKATCLDVGLSLASHSLSKARSSNS